MNDKHIANWNQRDWEVNGGFRPLQIAVIGVGGFTRSHILPALEQTDYCESTVLVSDSPDKANKMMNIFSIQDYLDYDEFEKGVSRTHYDAVYIATPNALHLKYTKIAARYGKHVLCEKPLEISANRVYQMIELCNQNNVILMPAYRMQLSPIIRNIREIMRNGLIGKPIHIHSGFSYKTLPRKKDSNWRLDPNLSGGCAIMDVGIYPINISRFLLNEEPTTVYGKCTSNHPQFAEVDEHVSYQLNFQNGITVSGSGSSNGFHSSFLDIMGYEGRIKLEPAYEPNTWRLVKIETEDDKLFSKSIKINEIIEQFDYFGYCIYNDLSPQPDGNNGLEDVRIIDAIKNSFESEREVSVNHVS